MKIYIIYTLHCNTIYGLPINTNDNTKRESDFSYFHCGYFGTDLQVIVRHGKVISTPSYNT